MSDNDRFAILATIESIEKIEEFTKNIHNPDDFFNNKIIFDATLMNFITIGEMVARISDELKAKYDKIEWNKIKNFRNIIAHDYLGIDAEEIWQIIIDKIIPLKEQLKNINGRLK